MSRHWASRFMDSAGSSADSMLLLLLIPVFIVYGICWLIYYIFNRKAVHAQWAEEKRQREEHEEMSRLIRTAQNRHELISAMYNRHGENFEMDAIASDGSVRKVRFNRV